MDVNLTLAELQNLLALQKPKKSDLERIKLQLEVLLREADGRSALADAMHQGTLRKSIVYDVVVDWPRGNLGGRSPEVDRSTMDLLEQVATHAKKNDSAKWRAFDLLLSAGDVGATMRFADALGAIEPKKDLALEYAKHIKPHMAGGGLGWLKKVLDSARGQRLRPYVYDLLREPAVEQSTLQSEGSSGSGVDGQPQVEAPAASDGAGRSASEVVAILSSAVEKVREFLEHQRSRELAQKTRLSDLSSELQAYKRQIEALTSEVEARDSTVESSEEAKRRLQSALVSLEKEVLELQHKVLGLSNDLETTKARARQDAAIAQGELKNAVSSFRHELWAELSAYMLEAMDSSVNAERLPLEQQILLRRLRDVLAALRRFEVAPGA